MELIDKATIVTEIEKRIKKYASIDVGNSSELEALYGAKCKALTEILSFLDTLELEVKKVNLEQEIQNIIHKRFHDFYGIVNSETGEFADVNDMVTVAKYFFQLGLKTKRK